MSPDNSSVREPEMLRSIKHFSDAIFVRDYQTVRKALANGVDVNAKIPGSMDPIVVAQTNRDMKMLKILWKAGAQPVTPWLEAVFTDFANGGNGSNYKQKKARPVGKFILHRFNGDEQCALGPATIHITHGDGQSSVYLDARTNSPVTLSDSGEWPGHPHAWLWTTLPLTDPMKFTGMKLSVADSYDHSIDDWVTDFYFFEHQGLEENEVRFLSRRKNKYLIKWTGVTIDATLEMSKPQMKIEIEG